jgi:hypothetical protein
MLGKKGLLMIATLTSLASIATAVAVIVAAWQLFLSRKQAITSFEDSLAKEYRELAARLPTKALLGETLDDKEYADHFDEMYHYIDLCNEQAFLWEAGRISAKTWQFWRDGIASNLKRPAFARAWSEIAARSCGDFSELRAICPPKPDLWASSMPNSSLEGDAAKPRASG